MSNNDSSESRSTDLSGKSIMAYVHVREKRKRGGKGTKLPESCSLGDVPVTFAPILSGVNRRADRGPFPSEVVERNSLPIRIEKGWDLEPELGPRVSGAYWQCFRKVKVNKKYHAVCLLCNDGVLLGSEASQLRSHLVKMASRESFLSKETLESLKTKPEEPCGHFHWGHDQVSQAAHAIVLRMIDAKDGGQHGGEVSSQSRLRSVDVVKWGMDVANAAWVCADKRSLRTLFTPAFRAREKIVVSSSCQATTRYRLEQAIVSLYVAVKREVFELVKVAKQYFGPIPHVHYSIDGWSARSREELFHTCVSLMLPAHAVPSGNLSAEDGSSDIRRALGNEDFVRVNVSLGARLCDIDPRTQSISKERIAKFITSLLAEFGITVSTTSDHDDSSPSDVLSSTTDMGSNIRGATDMFQHAALPCFAHVLCNAVQWSLGLKAAQTKNASAKAFMTSVRAFTKVIRGRKIKSAIESWCISNSYSSNTVTMFNETRWNSSFLTMLQLLWLERPLMNAFLKPAMQGSFGSCSKEKEKFQAIAAAWQSKEVQGFARIKAILPTLHLAFKATQSLQGSNKGLVDGFLALLELRASLMVMCSISTDEKSSVLSNLFISTPRYPLIFGCFLSKGNGESHQTFTQERVSAAQNRLLGLKGQLSDAAKVHFSGLKRTKVRWEKVHNRWCEFRKGSLDLGVALKLLEQVDTRFFDGSLAKDALFKVKHDRQGLKWGNPHRSPLTQDAIMATVLLDPYVAHIFFMRKSFEELQLTSFDNEFKGAIKLIESTLRLLKEDEVDDIECLSDDDGNASDASDDSFGPSSKTKRRKLDLGESSLSRYESLRNYLVMLLDANRDSNSIAYQNIAKNFAENPNSSMRRMLSFWTSPSGRLYGQLYKVALSFANIGCTSAEVERHASSSGLIDVAKRHALRKSYFEMQEFLTDNPSLLGSTVQKVKTNVAMRLSQSKAKAILKKGCHVIRHDKSDVAASDESDSSGLPPESLLEDIQLSQEELEVLERATRDGLEVEDIFRSFSGVFDAFDLEFEEPSERNEEEEEGGQEDEEEYDIDSTEEPYFNSSNQVTLNHLNWDQHNFNLTSHQLTSHPGFTRQAQFTTSSFQQPAAQQQRSGSQISSYKQIF